MRPPSDRKVELNEIPRVAARIERIVMEDYVKSSAKQVHVTYNARK